MKRPLILVVALLSAFLVACSGSGSGRELANVESLEFLPNQGVYQSFTGDSFAMNLMFHAPKSFGPGPGEVQDVRLLPESDVVRQESYEIRDSTPGRSVLRKHLAVDLETTRPGEHTFGEVEVRTTRSTRRYPLGILQVRVEDGRSAGLFVLMESAGVHPTSEPLIFSVRNTTPDTEVMKDVLVNHPLIHFGRGDIIVDGSPIPADGLSLQPEQTARVRIDWSIDFPTRLGNLEARPILAVKRRGRVDYVGLHNMVFRYDPEWVASRQARDGKD